MSCHTCSLFFVRRLCLLQVRVLARASQWRSLLMLAHVPSRVSRWVHVKHKQIPLERQRQNSRLASIHGARVGWCASWSQDQYAPAESKHSRAAFAKSDDQLWEKASVHIDPAVSIQLHVAREAVPLLLRPCLSSLPSSVGIGQKSLQHHFWTRNTEHGLKNHGRCSITKFWKTRASDQQEETTVNELRVDDIAMDHGGRLRLLQYASVLSFRLTHDVPLRSNLVRQRN